MAVDPKRASPRPAAATPSPPAPGAGPSKAAPARAAAAVQAPKAAVAAVPAKPGSPADIAKAALRRLALAKLEPTPENYAQAWSDETGQPVSLASAASNSRSKPVLERLAARLFDEPAQR